MAIYHRVHVRLRKKDRQRIAEMLTKGRDSARVLRRASILRQLDQGQRAAQVADNTGVAAKTVRFIARRYEEEGLQQALHEKPRPGKQRALDAGQSRRIIAMVCSSPPQGQARWSVRLIASEAVKRKLAPRVGRELANRFSPCATRRPASPDFPTSQQRVCAPGSTMRRRWALATRVLKADSPFTASQFSCFRQCSA